MVDQVIVDIGEADSIVTTSAIDEETNYKSESVISPQISHADRVESFAPAMPAYVDGQEIEYFSNTDQRWVPGVVQVTKASSKECDTEFGIAYNVTLSEGRQFRENVGLDFLRPFLSPGESVELLSRRQGGTRFRLAAIIAESQMPVATRLGHRVNVEGSGDVFDSVPSLRLKRRYVRNQEVEVYRGSRRGWQLAKVHHTAMPYGCGERVLFPGDTEQKTIVLAERARRRVISSTTPEKITRQDDDILACEVGLWSVVPLYSQMGQKSTPPEWVPSYLNTTACSDR